MQKILLIQPPFTQLNTPYPATAYLKGFLNTLSIPSSQLDLGIATILEIFSKKGLQLVFETIEGKGAKTSENAHRILRLKQAYLQSIDAVIAFLQGENPTLANLICTRNYLPEASRFSEIADLEWSFGTIGIHDKARHLATLYLEDISDLIIEQLDPHFGFSRYAERLGRSARHFDELYAELLAEPSFVDNIYLHILEAKMLEEKPDIVAFSVPFPGNLYAAFKCAQYIKNHFPNSKTLMGGGFANTELRSLKEPRVFDFFDFISLDDGEAPLLNLIEYFEGKRKLDELKRCFVRIDQEVVYINGSKTADIKQQDTGLPDYSGLALKKYLSVIEIANPMHRLWSDGRWNKLTLAHGCYWGKCTFCDVSLDYIKIYEATTAKILVDRIETMMQQTGESGFHFVDEAAPPALMRELALEILKRRLTVTWWTNIRFEKSFTADLCRLLAASGCIAVSGGLEVASDRLLALIDKGVTVAQVSKVAQNFSNAGIMVHAYLMYGYPSQTVQETIDSLEIVRQLYENGVVQSGFWHQFALTAHSPVGLNPQQFGIEIIGLEKGPFANNDLEFEDKTGIDHHIFSQGLKTSLYNYMHGLCFEYDLQEWFAFSIPKSTIHPLYIDTILCLKEENALNLHKKITWLGLEPILKTQPNDSKRAELIISNKTTEHKLVLKTHLAEWLFQFLQKIPASQGKHQKIAQTKTHFEENNLGSFEKFCKSKTFEELREIGLTIV